MIAQKLDKMPDAPIVIACLSCMSYPLSSNHSMTSKQPSPLRVKAVCHHMSAACHAEVLEIMGSRVLEAI